uniref:mitogen-activated protein kinase n=1 Tax=Cyanistes caeruleus TaxID=156563 RepID=A0A8C0VC89_CYACU
VPIPSTSYALELMATVQHIKSWLFKKTPPHSGISAVDGRSGTKVAIKKLYRPFQSELFAKRAYRELRLLKHMKHENVINLIGFLSFFSFVLSYLVMPFMGTDLSKIMKHEKLTEDRIQFLVYQMLKGLKDLKPGNLAVNEDCELKILDFGLARHTDSEMTGYVVTRWYRAPEVILNWMHYTQTVDIWSVGCIMAEMITGRPLFKGNDHLDQLTEIMKVTGTPTQDFVQKLHSQDVSILICQLIFHWNWVCDLNTLLVFCAIAVNLLEKMLVLDAEKRVTAAEALMHPYFEPVHDPEEEIEAEKYDDTFDNMDLPLDEWKRITYKEILNFKPPQTLDSKETAV